MSRRSLFFFCYDTLVYYAALQSRAAKRTTLTWTDFSSTGFTRMYAPLITTLQFSPPLINSISSWPEQQTDKVIIEESFIDMFSPPSAPTIYQPKQGHHDSCNPRRVFVHSHKLERYIPPLPPVTLYPCYPSSHGRSYLLHRRCGESTGRQWIPRSHSRYCPVFHLHRCDPAVRNHALRSDVW
jgi:hypothetical protein